MKISTRIFIGYALILLLFGVVIFVNRKLSEKVNENTDWLTRSESVIRNTGRLQRTIIDMENGFRGFLLTGKKKFLTPYIEGSRNIPLLVSDVRMYVNQAEFQSKKLDTIKALVLEWQEKFTEPLIYAKLEELVGSNKASDFDKLFENELKTEVGKKMTDQIKEKFKEFNEYEYALRLDRRNKLITSISDAGQITIILIILSIVVGLISAFYTTNIIVKRIRDMVNIAERISMGNFKIEVKDDTHDELRRLSDSLNRMSTTLDETFTGLERSNAELNQFAYVVSHDLKAPLRGIDNVLMWIEEDVGENVDPKTGEYLHLIKGRVKRMENLINGILEFSRIGRTNKTQEEVNIGDLINEIIELISPPPGFRFHIQPDMPVITTERVYLYQVFANLVSNAIKYHHSSQGNITISWADHNENLYRFTVSDDGPGIEADYHQKIFMIFQTLKERDAFESTGVGLAIVKKIVEEKGGIVELESESGKGSSFSFTWPKNEVPN